MDYKLLLADDSIAIQKVVELMLSDEDIELLIADNGQKALEVTKKEKPDIVFIDADIPKMDGYEFCAKIRGNDELKNIPVVLLVAAFGSYDEKEAHEAGVTSHLSKPFLAEELLGKINDVISGKREVTELQESEEESAEKSSEAQAVLAKEKEERGKEHEEPQDEKESSFKFKTAFEDLKPEDDNSIMEGEDTIPLESISLEEEIKRAQERVDFSVFDTEELVNSLTDELSKRLPEKEEILAAVKETSQVSLKENINNISSEIKNAVKESLTSTFVDRSQVQDLVEKTVKENLGQIVQDIKGDVSNKAQESISSLTVEKEDILKVLSQSARESFQNMSAVSPSKLTPVIESTLKEKLGHLVDEMKADLTQKVIESFETAAVEKDDIMTAFNESAEQAFQTISSISSSELNPILESAMKEKLESIFDGLQDEIAQKVNDKCNTIALNTDDLHEALTKGAHESLKHVFAPSRYDMAETLKNSLSSLSFAKQESLTIIKESAHSALMNIFTDLIPEIKDNLISNVMRESLSESMKEVIKTVAWEVIPEIASKIVSEEIKKIREEG